MPFTLVPISGLPPYNMGVEVDPTIDEFAVRQGNTTYKISRADLTSLVLQAFFGGDVLIVKAAFLSNLNGVYDNGTAGVGANLESPINVALPNVPGQINAWAIGDKVLLANQSDETECGVYIIDRVGSGAQPWRLIRVTESDETSELQEQTVLATEGNNKGVFVQTKQLPVIGTDDIEYTRITGWPSIITITRSQALTLMANGQVQRNRKYFITDLGELGTMVNGLRSNAFESRGSTLIWMPDWENTSGFMIHPGGGLPPVWGDTMSAWVNNAFWTMPFGAQGYYCIWDNRHYENLTGNTTDGDPSVDNTNWDLKTPSLDNQYRYGTIEVGINIQNMVITSVRDHMNSNTIIGENSAALPFPYGNPAVVGNTLDNSDISPNLPYLFKHNQLRDTRVNINDIGEMIGPHAVMYSSFKNCAGLKFLGFNEAKEILYGTVEDLAVLPNLNTTNLTSLSKFTITPAINSGYGYLFLNNDGTLDDPLGGFEYMGYVLIRNLATISPVTTTALDGLGAGITLANINTNLAPTTAIAQTRRIRVFPYSNLQWIIEHGAIKTPNAATITLNGVTNDWAEFSAINGEWHITDFKKYS